MPEANKYAPSQAALDARDAPLPPEIDRWNWGAFLLSWIWGIGNNTFIAFLTFVPLVGIVMPFVLGAKGSAWAWRNKRWDSVEDFKATQRKWAIAGVITIAGMVVLVAVSMTAVFASLKKSEAYQMTVQALNADPEAVEMLGQPITTGIPNGNLNVRGPEGEASLSFSAEGPNGSGTVYMKAIKSLGQWQLQDAVLEDSNGGRRINLAD
ncbi:MAG TPA: cytochrome c oxidase assembly factor Coa1 family protein [Steroidobacteraceae bacterium]|nr:cytochrome c oxidase assembly factor Coa1 family protein [Steroidobacteraceae bacterium]